MYRDDQSGLVLEMLHLERPYGSDPSPFYTELHLGLVDPAKIQPVVPITRDAVTKARRRRSR